MDAMLIFTDCRDAVWDRTDSDAGVLFKALLLHGTGEEMDESEVPYAALPMYKILKRQIDRADIKYKETLEKRSAAGKKSGEVRRNKAEQRRTMMNSVQLCLNEREQTQTNANKRELPNPNPNPNPNLYTHYARAHEDDYSDLRYGLLE
ncbi:MAG: DUF6291 domain-containing protein [Bacteroidales bacterium]|nr:DUF6291 domain-containing protein [Bacteroidales bacterium]